MFCNNALIWSCHLVQNTMISNLLIFFFQLMIGIVLHQWNSWKKDLFQPRDDDLYKSLTKTNFRYRKGEAIYLLNIFFSMMFINAVPISVAFWFNPYSQDYKTKNEWNKYHIGPLRSSIFKKKDFNLADSLIGDFVAKACKNF